MKVLEKENSQKKLKKKLKCKQLNDKKNNNKDELNN